MPVNKSALLRYRIIDACLTHPQRRYPTMQQIIEKIESQLDNTISESMFSKDISQMKSMYNAPIKFDREHGGYHYTEPDFSIKEFPLTHEEIEALDFSTALLHQVKGTRLFQQFENAINKVIEGYRISKIVGKTETQFIQVEEPVKTAGSEWLEKILKGIIDKNVLLITYQAFGKEIKDHALSPYLLKEYRNRWYAVGYSDRAENILVLALDRVLDIRKCNNTFKTNTSFDADEYFKHSIGVTAMDHAKPEKVLLSFTPFQSQYILSQPIHHTQKLVKQNDKEVQVEIEVYVTHELIMNILSFGSGVTVVEPASLRESIRKTVEDIRKNYD
jgi:predicted DNA-binding transcriptional regulator YafY